MTERTYEELKSQVEEWFRQLFPNVWHVRGDFKFDEKVDTVGGNVLLCTATQQYNIAFTNDYLGCIASSRVARPGEHWLRGNDLYDGPFSQETMTNILMDILAYELVLIPVEEYAPIEVGV